ncbi:MAG: sigma 54-interacting transcriptional regulator [Verrucomicrobia bacterium]|nr:sigma 54-interacting transcriptional regulator [Verrucomicrobiota bacterium]
MSTRLKLSKEDREFFTIVGEGGFSNPFSPQREAFDRQLAGAEAGTSHEKQLERVSARIRARIDKLHQDGRLDLRAYSPDEGVILKRALLFDTYYRFRPQFDALIATQRQLGTDPAEVSFATEAIAVLRSAGLPLTVAASYFAMFYQLRRAYYFIDESLIGRSASIRKLRRRLWDNVFTNDIEWYERFMWNRMEDFSTLILGETGTGKGSAAAAIGRSGYIPFDTTKGRFARSFTELLTPLNLSQFPESLLESELFGHRKGAFTGAIDHYEGVLARCRTYGSVFLDEIGELSPPIQIKLLGVLQDRSYTPVGSHELSRFGGRIVAATNRDLDALRRDGRFRDDFYYRLCSDVITMPTLRERLAEDPQELDEMINHLVERLVGRDAGALADMIRDTLQSQLGSNYVWPGNVRELEQAIRRILLTRQYAGDHAAADPDRLTQLIRGIETGSLDAPGLLAQYSQLLYTRLGTYEAVADRMQIDRRTAKKYILTAAEQPAA